ncbi:MAG: SLC13 family permease [Infirmifilum sp.]
MRSLQGTFTAKLISVLFIALAAAFIANLAGFPARSVVAISIFFAEISATLLLWTYRLPIAFIGTSLLFLTGSLTLKAFLDHGNLDVIFFLIGMMTFMGILEETHFFDHIASHMLIASRGNPVLLLFTVSILSATLAALVDEVTSIVVMVSLILALTRKSKVSPVPLVLLSVFATNIGSSATLIGNPVGVLVAFRGGLTFEDFLRWATPISILSLSIMIILALRFYRNYLLALKLSAPQDEASGAQEVATPGEFRKNLLLFSTIISLLALHHQLEELFSLGKNTLLLAIPFAAAGVTMLMYPEKGLHAFTERVEWPTIIFFALLFASVGALDSSGFIDAFAHLIIQAAGGSLELSMVVYALTATLMSAFMDNVLAVSVLIHVVDKIAAAGLPPYPFYWVALFSATIGGNLTYVGSTANIVALGMLEKNGLQKPSFKEWLSYGWWATLVPLAVAITMIYVQAPLMRF